MKHSNNQEVFVLTYMNDDRVIDVFCFGSMKKGFAKMSEMYSEKYKESVDREQNYQYIQEANKPLVSAYIANTVAAASIMTLEESHEWRLFRKDVCQ